MRRTLKIVAVVLVLLALGVASIPFWIDRAARVAIEDGGRAALGVPTRVAKVRIGVFSGRARIEGFTVANPPGIEGSFLEIDRGETEIAYGSLFEKRIAVETVRLEGIRLRLGQVGEESNYGPILDHMRESQESGSAGGGSDGGGQDDADGMRYVIREIVLRDIDVTAKVKVAGIFRPTAHMHIDELRFLDMTEESSGAAISDVTAKVTQALLTSVVRQGGGVLPEEITEGIGGGLRGLGHLGVSILDGTGKVLGAGGKLVGGAVGALFGHKRDETGHETEADGD